MSFKIEVNAIIAHKLPAKGNRLKHGINAAGLHKRPQIEPTAIYFNFGQETGRFPDHEAKLIRNHPFMTQLNIFDAQEDKERCLACLLQRFEQWALAPKLASRVPD